MLIEALSLQKISQETSYSFNNFCKSVITQKVAHRRKI